MFDVNEEMELGDLSQVREEKKVLPPAKNVKFTVTKANLKDNAKNNDGKATWKWLEVNLQIAEGIPQSDGTTKYKNMVVYQNLCYYADPVKYSGDWFKKKQHLVGLTQFLKACGVPLTGVKMGDDLLAEVLGKEVIGNIVQNKEKAVNPDTGIKEFTGELSNEVKNFKAVE